MKRVAHILLFLMTAIVMHAQTQQTDSLVTDYYAKVPLENIYVQTDRTCYIPGDTIWFRAHLVDAVSRIPTCASKFVYVELHDQKADTLLLREMVKCDSSGVFANAIVLPEKMKSGVVTLVAYTQWMRNFGAENFFYKPLRVIADNAPVAVPVYKYDIHEGEIVNGHLLSAAIRNNALLIQPNLPSNTNMQRLGCVLCGSGNLTTITPLTGKVLRVSLQKLRPGYLEVAIVDMQSLEVLARRMTFIPEHQTAKVDIKGEAKHDKEEMSLDIDITDTDGLPLQGTFALSVIDNTIIPADTTATDIRQTLLMSPGARQSASLSDMFSHRYPEIEYNIQTSQLITGEVQGTIKKKINRPKLLVVNPVLGTRHEFELGDSSRFALSVDQPEHVPLLLEGTRKSGKVAFVELNVDSLTYPTPTLPRYDYIEAQHMDRFLSQATIQQHASLEIDLPELVTTAMKPKAKPMNFFNMEPQKGFPPGDPRIARAASMEELMHRLGIRIVLGSNGERGLWNIGKVYVDNYPEEDYEEVLRINPWEVKSIEFFTPNNAENSLFGVRPDFRGNLPGVLFIHRYDGLDMSKQQAKQSSLLSMVKVEHLGYRLPMNFYSPQYPDADKSHYPYSDNRTTIYWNPKVETDENGHAAVKYYASDHSRQYLVTLEGVTYDGIVIHHQIVIE